MSSNVAVQIAQQQLEGLRESAADIEFGVEGLRESAADIEFGVEGLRESEAKIELEGLREEDADVKLEGLREEDAMIELAEEMAGLREEAAEIEFDIAGLRESEAKIELEGIGGLREEDAAVVLQGLREEDARLQFELEGLREESAQIEFEAEEEMTMEGAATMGVFKKRRFRRIRRRQTRFQRRKRFGRRGRRLFRFRPFGRRPTRGQAKALFRGDVFRSPGRVFRGGRIEGLGNMGDLLEFLQPDALDKAEFAERVRRMRADFDALMAKVGSLPEQQRRVALVKMNDTMVTDAFLRGLEKIVRKAKPIRPRRRDRLVQLETRLPVVEKLVDEMLVTPIAADFADEKDRADEAIVTIVKEKQKANGVFRNVIVPVGAAVLGLGTVAAIVRFVILK